MFSKPALLWIDIGCISLFKRFCRSFCIFDRSERRIKGNYIMDWSATNLTFKKTMIIKKKKQQPTINKQHTTNTKHQKANNKQQDSTTHKPWFRLNMLCSFDETNKKSTKKSVLARCAWNLGMILTLSRKHSWSLHPENYHENGKTTIWRSISS